MSEFRFEALPDMAPNSRTKRSRQHLEAAAALRERPGEWAVIKTTPTSQAARSAATHIRTGLLAAYRPARSFEATSRTVEGEHRVYARFVGQPEGGAA